MQNTVHFVLQAKGGIGKSFVSTLLAQHLAAEAGAVRCFDTDQENTTFAHYRGLLVQEGAHTSTRSSAAGTRSPTRPAAFMRSHRRCRKCRSCSGATNISASCG